MTRARNSKTAMRAALSVATTTGEVEGKPWVDCAVCTHPRSSEEAIVLWREGALVFAVCHECTRRHDIVLRPSVDGVQVMAKARAGAPSRTEPSETVAKTLPRSPHRRTVLAAS